MKAGKPVSAARQAGASDIQGAVVVRADPETLARLREDLGRRRREGN
jgi:hypothetical protein